MSKIIQFFLFCLIGSILSAPVEDDYFLDEIDEIDEIDENDNLYPEYRTLFTLFGWNNDNKKVQKRIEDVTQWSIQNLDYSQCVKLPEIVSRLNGDVEKRTIDLKSILKFDLKFKHVLNGKYNKFVKEVQFINSTFPFLKRLLVAKLRLAEEIKNKILKEQNERFLKYQRDIQTRISKSLESPLGPKVKDLLFRNSTMLLLSNYQIEIIRNSLLALVKCYNSIKPKINDKSYIKYAEHILRSIKQYNYDNSLKIDSKYNVLSNYNVRRRVLINANLREFDDGLLNLRFFNLFTENSADAFVTVSDNEEKLDKQTNDNLKVAYNFNNFVSSIVNYVEDMQYNQIQSKCNVKSQVEVDSRMEYQIPTIENREFIDEQSIKSLTEKTGYIKEKCKLTKDLDECLDEIVDLGNKLKTILQDKVLLGYNDAIKNLLKVDVGSRIVKYNNTELNKVCEIKYLTDVCYNLTSAAQLNKALDFLEFGKRCLMYFGLQSENNFTFNKILPMDFINTDLIIYSLNGCSGSGLIFKNNEDKLLKRLNVSKTIKDNSFLSLNFDL